MLIDEKHFREITFQGETFPQTLMGISILVPVLNAEEDELNDWLWSLTICCGVTKRESSDVCARSALRAIELIHARFDEVLIAIDERLSPYGFDPHVTVHDWIAALGRIAELSSVTDDCCYWSAPSHPTDPIKSRADFDRFLDAFEAAQPTSDDN